MVQLLVHHKWFIRAALAVFWTAEIIAYAVGHGFITYLLGTHTWWSLIILFLTFKYLLEPFYAPVLKITKDGGETVMEKSTIILLALAALLGALVVLMAIPESRTVLINGFIQVFCNPLYLVGVSFNTWLATYPALWILGVGMLGGLILAIAVTLFAVPRIRSQKQEPQKDVGTTQYSTRTTPAGATTRPTATTPSTPLPLPVEQKPEPTPQLESEGA